MKKGAAGFVLIALAAALWGADGVFRRGLALELPAATVVFWEHLILVVVVAPTLVRAIRSARRLGLRERLALLMIGAGASATATALFTAAFRYGDPNTPLLLQKLQPFIAIAAAAALLGERLRPRFALFATLAIAGAWMITFADPFQVSLQAGIAGALAIGAAVLWALGTVLGRYLTAALPAQEITALRFGIGLPASALLVMTFGGVPAFAIRGGDFVPLVLLALIPGLLALTMYYRGLRTTPASVATIAELAFPLSAIVLNYLIFGATLTGTQWVGIVLLASVLFVMSRRSHKAGSEGVGVTEPATIPLGA